MTTHPERVAPPQPPTLPESGERRSVSKSVLKLQVTLMECHITALEQELEAERERRQAVVDRYERILAEQ